MIEWFKRKIVYEWVLKSGKERNPYEILTKVIVVAITINAIFFAIIFSIAAFF